MEPIFFPHKRIIPRLYLFHVSAATFFADSDVRLPSTCNFGTPPPLGSGNQFSLSARRIANPRWRLLCFCVPFPLRFLSSLVPGQSAPTFFNTDRKLILLLMNSFPISLFFFPVVLSSFFGCNGGPPPLPCDSFPPPEFGLLLPH